MRYLTIAVALVVVATLIACGGGKSGNPGKSNSPGTLTNATSDFDGLGAWCETSGASIDEARAANPIRGDELKDNHLKQLRTAILDKEIHWRMKVNTITQSSVTLRAWHACTKPGTDASGRRSNMEVAVLNVQFREPGFWAGDWRDSPAFIITSISPDKLRSISVGDFVTATGKVKDVTAQTNVWTNTNSYVVKVLDARIE